jgi:hypothetical protein
MVLLEHIEECCICGNCLLGENLLVHSASTVSDIGAYEFLPFGELSSGRKLSSVYHLPYSKLECDNKLYFDKVVG